MMIAFDWLTVLVVVLTLQTPWILMADAQQQTKFRQQTETPAHSSECIAGVCGGGVQLLQQGFALLSLQPGLKGETLVECSQRDAMKLPCTTAPLPAADGFDVTSFFDTTLMAESGPVKGYSEFSIPVGTSTFFFSSEVSKQRFEADPESFLPQFGGFCALSVADRELRPDDWSTAKFSNTSFAIIGGRLYVFRGHGSRLLFFNVTTGSDMHSSLDGLTTAQKVEQAHANWEKALTLSNCTGISPTTFVRDCYGDSCYCNSVA